MHDECDTNIPFIFLGLAEHIEREKAPFPIGNLSIFRLSHYKFHFIFPISINDYFWVFLINQKLVDKLKTQEAEILIGSADGKELGNIRLSYITSPDNEKVSFDVDEAQSKIFMPKGIRWLIAYCQFEGAIPSPATYFIRVHSGNQEVTIGEVIFFYEKILAFTLEEMKAIEADPYSVKAVKVELGCKHCASKLLVYSALERNEQFENEGCIWQHDLPTSFTCECGRTSENLIYLKESLHGLLGKDFHAVSKHLSYVRRYAHSEIVKIVQQFTKLLKEHKNEEPFQKFIEAHPVLLSRFHAKKLFIKPNILGKFQPDFVILDSRNQLVFIELEKPALKLFKKDGHPTAVLMHAYGQVRDWLHEYANHQAAILDGLKLKREEVMTVKGIVIAGKIQAEKREHLQRHLSTPLYHDIEFLTLNDLSDSLLQISRDLA